MKIYFVFFFILFLSMQLLSQEFIKDDSIKYWSKNNHLKWNDFLGKPLHVNLEYSLLEKDEAMAISSINFYWKNFYLKGNKIPYFIFINYFKKKSSWTIDTLSIILLEHEQIHFDISEIFVRKLRQGVSLLNKKGITNMNVYENLIDSLYNESDKLDNTFDKETHHGQILNAQRRWSEFVKTELEKLKEFEVIDYKKYFEQPLSSAASSNAER